MQRIFAFLIVLSAAFNLGCASTSQPAPVREVLPVTPAQPAEVAQPAPPPASTVQPVVETPPPAASPLAADVKPQQAAGRNAHIALLLPLDSASFGPAAEAVKRGAVAASDMEIPAALPLHIYPTNDRVEDIVSVYRQALQAGAKIVVGPLTRNAVTALSKSGQIGVPTLALNYPEGDVLPPDNLYLFGLTAEADAVQCARLAFADGRRSALTIAINTPLAKRVQQAFVHEWQALGGTLSAQTEFSPEQTQFSGLRDLVQQHPADMIFLAMDAKRAQLMRPYLDASIPTYATTMIANGQEIGRNIDLNGILFAEMPWLLLPDHPAVMIYPRGENASIEQQRLYALGIDAYRLAAIMARNPRPPEGSVLDGVTGQISLIGHQFQREMPVAQFRQGSVVAVESGAVETR